MTSSPYFLLHFDGMRGTFPCKPLSTNFDPGTIITHPSAFHFQILTGRVHVRRRGRSRERRRRQDGLGQRDAESHGRSSAANVAAEVKAEAVGGVVAASVPGAVEPTGGFG